MKYWELETPCLLIDREKILKNLKDMQSYADSYNCTLRPHSKTHKSPYMAKLSIEIGAKGIAVAKTEEAVVMVQNGISDIFIANQIVDPVKIRKIRDLNKIAEVFGTQINLDHFCSKHKSFNVVDRIYVHQDSRFEWPDANCDIKPSK